ncbi:hypothetical protein HMN09_00881800 [Mycena chlorophos]|uniref:Uncharacterized protein n=1 Tax=Mycena chlorophos TaxID=658473 RepID=A0A8H6SP73_MYCCL|nr:hypothetical protein HMN09_00881800 [Mycena chlorophos]
MQAPSQAVDREHQWEIELLDAGELDGDALVDSLEKRVTREIEILKKLSAHDRIRCQLTGKQWEQVERTRMGGYNGLAPRTQRYCAQQAREKDQRDIISRASPAANKFTGYFGFKPKPNCAGAPEPPLLDQATTQSLLVESELISAHDGLDGYASDISDDAEDFFGDDEDDEAEFWYDEDLADASAAQSTLIPQSNDEISSPDPSPSATDRPPRKRRRLGEPVLVPRSESSDSQDNAGTGFYATSNACSSRSRGSWILRVGITGYWQNASAALRRH